VYGHNVTGYSAVSIATADRLFGERLRALREERGMSQQTLVALLVDLGISSWHQTTVGKVEVGTRSVRLAEAIAVAAVFDMTVDELLEDPDSEHSRSRRARQLLARGSELAVIESLLQDRERQLDAWLDEIEADHDS
jgi:transcriptional regulator with XRE-family HTH domain